MKRYLKLGMVSAAYSGLLNVIVYILFRLSQGNDIQWIGEDRGSLYIVTILFISILASVLGALLYGVLKKAITKHNTIYITIVILLTVLSSVASEILLHQEFKWMAHVLHLVVALISVWILIGKSNKS